MEKLISAAIIYGGTMYVERSHEECYLLACHTNNVKNISKGSIRFGYITEGREFIGANLFTKVVYIKNFDGQIYIKRENLDLPAARRVADTYNADPKNVAKRKKFKVEDCEPEHLSDITETRKLIEMLSDKE
jgi:hypothetical protein